MKAWGVYQYSAFGELSAVKQGITELTSMSLSLSILLNIMFHVAMGRFQLELI